MLEVLSFNVLAPQFIAGVNSAYDEYYQGQDVSRRSKRIAAVIRKGDVTFLEEVEDLDLKQFEEEYVVLTALHRSGYWEAPRPHGNALLLRRSRCHLLSSESVELTDDGNTGLVVRMRCATQDVILACVHLECDADVANVMRLDTAEALQRRAQLEALEQAVARQRVTGNELVIVAGDFNAPFSTFGDFASRHVDVTRDLGHRTEFDSNGHVYNAPVDLITYARQGGERVRTELHRFPAPGAALSQSEKVAFLLEKYGSDHMPVACTIHF
jgi:endonuclease/exonuclease/phosphatase family metal-dependent hydrolase